MPAAAGGGSTSGFAPLRVRDYRLLLYGLIASSAMMPLQFVTQIFWIQDAVGAGAQIVLVGLVGTMRGLGALTFGLYGGALADRFDRRRLLMVTQTVGIVLNLSVAAVMWWSDGDPWGLVAFFVLTFLASGTFAIDLPTRQAMVPEILGPRLLPAGISLNTAAGQIAMPVSLFASGMLIEALGFAGAYALSGAALAFEVLMLALMRFEPEARAVREGAYGVRAMLDDVREGVRYTRGNPTVLWIIVLMVGMMSLGFPAVANLGPTWITTVVGVSVRNFGIIAVTWGLGAFVTSLAMARFSDYPRKGLLLSLGAVAFAAGFAIFAFPSIPTAVTGNLILGVGMTMSQVSATTLVQLIVPNEVRGRVMSLLQLNMGFAQLITFPLAAIGQAISLEVLFPILAASVSFLVLAIVSRQRKLLAGASMGREGSMPHAAATMASPPEEPQPTG